VSDAFWLIAISTVLATVFAVVGWWIDRKLKCERERDVLPPPCRSTERPGSVAEFRRRMAARRYVA
jgi:hypothetical protein